MNIRNEWQYYYLKDMSQRAGYFFSHDYEDEDEDDDDDHFEDNDGKDGDSKDNYKKDDYKKDNYNKENHDKDNHNKDNHSMDGEGDDIILKVLRYFFWPQDQLTLYQHIGSRRKRCDK